VANPLSEEKELYERIRREGIAIKSDIWDFVYRRVNDNTTAIILLCQRWLENKKTMPVHEAGRILTWTKDIKNTISAITTPSKESLLFPQLQNASSLNPIVQELITHQFGNDIYAIELMVQDAIDYINPLPVPLEVLQKIIDHAQTIRGFLEKFHNTVQWKDSEEKFRNLYDSFRDGLAMTDIKGYIVDANQAYVNMLNYTKEEIIKLAYQQLTPEKWHKSEEEIVKSLITKEENSVEYEKEYIKKDGTVFPVSLKVLLIKDTQGNPLGMWSVVRDITESKKMQREFEEEIFASYAVIDNISVGLSLSDKSGRFEILNSTLQKITGYTIEEINKQGLAVLLYPEPEERKKAISRLSEIAVGKGTIDVQTIIKAKDGLERILSVSTSLINYKSSDMFLSIWRDITESKRLQDALRNSEVRFRRLFETAQDGILILDADTGQIREVNPFLIHMLGYSHEEFLGKKLWEVGAFIDIDKSKAAFQALQTKGYVRYEDLPLKTNVGRIIDVEFVSNVYEVDHMKVIQCNIRDISERRQLQDSLKVSETRFRRLFETAQDGILILDAGIGQITEVNKFLIDMLGYSREEFLGKKLWEIGAFIDIDKSKTAFEELQTKGYIRYEDLPLRTKDGRPINVEFVSNVYNVDNTKVIQCNIRDITERKRLASELFKVNGELLEANVRLQNLALKDSHTGLYNHRYLKEAIEVGFSRAERQGTFLSVIMMDIDYFKTINDVYGHVFGDLVLKQFAVQLTKAVRPYDVVIRYGGEEFVIVSADTDREGAQALGKRILEEVNLYSFGDNAHSIKIKLSLAVATYPEDSIQINTELVDYADQILYKAKEDGGNRVYTSLDLKKEPGRVDKLSDIHSLKEKIAKLTKRVNQSLIEETMAFAKAIELKDHYTGKHVEKTVGYAAKISQRLHFSNDKIELIKEAAMLHDLGKVGISENILNKKSKLSKEEFEEIKKHPQIGVDIISPIHSLHAIVPFLLYHHERWDGKGYPHGLSGERIPLGARVIAIADVYQALVSDRPYRKAYSKEKAVTIIKEGSGTRFDQNIVNTFLMVLQNEQ